MPGSIHLLRLFYLDIEISRCYYLCHSFVSLSGYCSVSTALPPNTLHISWNPYTSPGIIRVQYSDAIKRALADGLDNMAAINATIYINSKSMIPPMAEICRILL